MLKTQEDVVAAFKKLLEDALAIKYAIDPVEDMNAQPRIALVRKTPYTNILLDNCLFAIELEIKRCLSCMENNKINVYEVVEKI
jgi:hypothetical protein